MTQQDDITQRVLTEAEKDNIYTAWQDRRDEASYGDLIDDVESAVLSKLRAPVSSIREGFELTYAADADDPACATDLFHFTNGWRACVMFQVRAPVAGEAQIIGYVPPIYLELRRRGLPVNSKIQHSPADDATAPLYAAPQASAEPTHKPVMSVAEFCAEAGRLDLTADTLAAQLSQRPEFADCLPQADKDGGQQRAPFDHPVFAFLLGEGPLHGVHFGDRHPSERGAYWWRKDLRAALSASQAEQGERDA